MEDGLEGGMTGSNGRMLHESTRTKMVAQTEVPMGDVERRGPTHRKWQPSDMQGEGSERNVTSMSPGRN